MKIPKDIDIPIPEWIRLIDEWIVGEKNRAMLKAYLIDCKTYYKIGEEFEFSERQIARIIPPLKERLFDKARKSL